MAEASFPNWYTPDKDNVFVSMPKQHVVCMWCGAQIPAQDSFMTTHSKFHEWVNSLASLLSTVTEFFERITLDDATAGTQAIIRDMEDRLKAVSPDESNEHGP